MANVVEIYVSGGYLAIYKLETVELHLLFILHSSRIRAADNAMSGLGEQ